MHKTLKQHLREYGGRPKRSLGQVFLIERSVQQKIFELAGLDREDTVLEIGPGTGALTRELFPEVKRLIALEVDPALTSYLRTSLKSPSNLHLICTDALRFDYLRASTRLKTIIKVIANLPYVISTPLMFTFIEQRQAFSLLILMLQAEVAQRLTASPGTKDYGALTVLCRFHFDIRIEHKVSRNCFYPVPKVDSAIIRCVPTGRDTFGAGEEAVFRTVVKAAFSKRRKTLFNTLRLSRLSNLTEKKLRLILDQCAIDHRRRPETLSLEEFIQLTLCFCDVWGISK